MPQPFGPKDPDEVDFINFDFAARLAAVGDTIATVVAVEPEGVAPALLIDEIADEDGVVSARWQGGDDATDYTVVCEITTTAGRTWTERGTVSVTTAD